MSFRRDLVAILWGGVKKDWVVLVKRECMCSMEGYYRQRITEGVKLEDTRSIRKKQLRASVKRDMTGAFLKTKEQL